MEHRFDKKKITNKQKKDARSQNGMRKKEDRGEGEPGIFPPSLGTGLPLSCLLLYSPERKIRIKPPNKQRKTCSHEFPNKAVQVGLIRVSGTFCPVPPSWARLIRKASY